MAVSSGDSRGSLDDGLFLSMAIDLTIDFRNLFGG